LTRKSEMPTFGSGIRAATAVVDNPVNSPIIILFFLTLLPSYLIPRHSCCWRALAAGVILCLLPAVVVLSTLNDS